MANAPTTSNPGDSGKRRVAQYLIDRVGVGGIFHWRDVKREFSDDSQIDRRGRELRGHGWVISTYLEDPNLAPDQVRLDKIGTMP